MANFTEEKCQKSGKKYGLVCSPCRSTFVASLLKKPLGIYIDIELDIDIDIWNDTQILEQ